MEFIKLSLEEELAVVTIDRPKSLNALNSQVYREIIATLRQVEAMDQVKVVILTGAGEKAFAAGADIAQMVHEDAVAGRCRPRPVRPARGHLGHHSRRRRHPASGADHRSGTGQGADLHRGPD